MRRTQNEARLSAQWFENLSRYIDLEPRQFGALVHARRSALLPLLPPRLFYHLNHASQEIGILRQIRRRIGPLMMALHRRRTPVPPTGGDG